MNERMPRKAYWSWFPAEMEAKTNESEKHPKRAQ